MRKAHLFQAISLFNQGVDDAVCGVQRLRKAPELTLDTYVEGAAELELRRSKINVQFLSDLAESEKADLQHFDDELGELLDEPLDHVKICQLMRIVEQQRQEEGQPSMVQFTDAAPPPAQPPGETSAPPAAA
jgi:hypothetical protein